jgi:hypothetical protein
MSKQSAHFSFSNSLYDNCNLEKKNQESTAPYKWLTDDVKESKSACYVNQTPYMHKQFQSIPFNKIDIESDLRNQTRSLTRCPDGRFDPTKLENCKDCHNCNQGLPCSCNHCKQTKYENELKDCANAGLVPAYTRVNKPCNIFSGITINRFNPLVEDLTDLNKIHSNSYIGTNTRNQIKDAFKEQRPHKLN